MISSLVSSILTPVATNSADRTAAQQFDDRKNAPIMATAIAARPVISSPIDPIVDQGGPAGEIDYFHAAKHMLGKAFDDLHHDTHKALAGLGFGDDLAGKLTQAAMKKTKDALLWGVGFSIKLMTATVSQTSATSDGASASSFNVAARSIEIKVNHTSGAINVNADKVSIESQNHGVPGAQQPHLLDIKDTDTAPVRSLSSALQALDKPETLFDNDADDGAPGDTTAAVAVTTEKPAFKGVLPLPEIKTPTVITKPEYRARFMVSSMEHFLNEDGDTVTHLRLDTVIPLAAKVEKQGESATAS